MQNTRPMFHACDTHQSQRHIVPLQFHCMREASLTPVGVARGTSGCMACCRSSSFARRTTDGDSTLRTGGQREKRGERGRGGGKTVCLAASKAVARTRDPFTFADAPPYPAQADCDELLVTHPD